jgi:hypothetical protein
MKDLTRRRFLTRSSVGVAFAGALAVVPFMAGAMKHPGASPMLASGSATTAGPLVAHVRDFATGEIAFLVGSRRFIVRDPDLAVRLHSAAAKR